MAVQLESDTIDAPGAEQVAVFLHGILGSGQNLRTLARRFVTARPGWSAWLVDLRGHGSSPKRSPEPSLAAAARDVLDLTRSSALPIGAIIGHSFGGKVALEMVRQGLVPDHVVVLDSIPGPRLDARGSESTLEVIEMLERLPETFASREEFVAAVVAAGQARPLAQWLAISLERAPSGYGFGPDLGEIRALLTSYFEADLWPVIESPPERSRIHLVIGDRSPVWSAEDRARALALATERVTVDVLPAGHWIHVEDPEGVLRVMLQRTAG